MKKIASFSVLTAVALSAQILPSNVLGNSSLAKENGGAKYAIDAYTDGSGGYVIESANEKSFDNSPMNTLVFKYGESAKSNDVTIPDQVKVLDTSSTAIEKALANKIDISAMTPKDGTACDDGLAYTAGETYHNGVCSGGMYQATANTAYSCSSGTLSGQSCTTTTTTPATANTAYSCSSGALSGQSCTVTSAYTATLNNNYSCPSGGTLSGTTCLKSSSYVATGTLVGNGTWTLCAYDTQTCSFSGTRRVKYHNGGTTFATITTTSSAYCYPSTFGLGYDPAYGVRKQCSYENQTMSYSCPSGGTLSGTTCTINQNYTATNTPYYTCSSGTLSGQSCTTTTTTPATANTTYSCSSGTLSGQSCTTTTTTPATANTTYSCPNGGALNYTICVK